jgi:hypothetical protein
MTDPAPDGPEPQAVPGAADPTLRVARPPTPGRAVRADVAAGNLATPPFREDDPTVTLTGQVPRAPQRTLRFGTPTHVRVSVTPRPRRRHRTWPWIVAVIVALAVLGTVLLVMLLNGATIDGDTDVVGWAPSATPAAAGRAGTG